MATLDSVQEKVWEWLRQNKPKRAKDDFQFTAQTVHGQFVDEDYVDALWGLANAGIVRLYRKDLAYSLTQRGRQLLDGALSVYQGVRFLTAVKSEAEHLDSDASAYFEMALECALAVPHAAIALVRVAFEVELGSVIDQFITSANSGIGAGTRKKLLDRDASVRLNEIAQQIQSRSLLTKEDAKEFETTGHSCRLEGNRVLHPKEGAPQIDPVTVQAAFHAFRRFAILSSQLKKTMEK